MSGAFLSQESPLLECYIAYRYLSERRNLILVQRGFEQNHLNFTRDAAYGCIGRGLSRLQGPKSLLLSAYHTKSQAQMHQLARSKPFANCSAQRGPFYKLPLRGGAFSSLHEGTSVSTNPGNSSSHYRLNDSSPKNIPQRRPAAAAR